MFVAGVKGVSTANRTLSLQLELAGSYSLTGESLHGFGRRSALSHGHASRGDDADYGRPELETQAVTRSRRYR